MCIKHSIPFHLIYNADQTGLYFRKMPNRIYVNKDAAEKRSKRGVKAMKAKDRITVMVCTSASGGRFHPLLA